MGTTIEKTHRVKGYGPQPKTAAAALRQASKLLMEEGRWIQGSEIEHTDGTPVKIDDPFCGSWGVCAIGALAAVTGDFATTRYKDSYAWGGESQSCSIPFGLTSPIYEEALLVLDTLAQAETYKYDDDPTSYPFDGIVDYNDRDGRTRDEVVAKFDEAAKIAARIARAEAKAKHDARTKVLATVGA